MALNSYFGTDVNDTWGKGVTDPALGKSTADTYAGKAGWDLGSIKKEINPFGANLPSTYSKDRSINTFGGTKFDQRYQEGANAARAARDYASAEGKANLSAALQEYGQGISGDAQAALQRQTSNTENTAAADLESRQAKAYSSALDLFEQDTRTRAQNLANKFKNTNLENAYNEAMAQDTTGQSALALYDNYFTPGGDVTQGAVRYSAEDQARMQREQQKKDLFTAASRAFAAGDTETGNSLMLQANDVDLAVKRKAEQDKNDLVMAQMTDALDKMTPQDAQILRTEMFTPGTQSSQLFSIAAKTDPKAAAELMGKAGMQNLFDTVSGDPRIEKADANKMRSILHTLATTGKAGPLYLPGPGGEAKQVMRVDMFINKNGDMAQNIQFADGTFSHVEYDPQEIRDNLSEYNKLTDLKNALRTRGLMGRDKTSE